MAEMTRQEMLESIENSARECLELIKQFPGDDPLRIQLEPEFAKAIAQLPLS